jgi:hypothetical protein
MMFFAAFFDTLFYMRIFSIPDLAGFRGKMLCFAKSRWSIRASPFRHFIRRASLVHLACNIGTSTDVLQFRGIHSP